MMNFILSMVKQLTKENFEEFYYSKTNKKVGGKLMTVSKWAMRYNNGTTWSSKYSISNPTNDITIDMNTTRRKHNLYDGSIGRTIPTTKYTYANVDLDWAF